MSSQWTLWRWWWLFCHKSHCSTLQIMTEWRKLWTFYLNCPVENECYTSVQDPKHNMQKLKCHWDTSHWDRNQGNHPHILRPQATVLQDGRDLRLGKERQRTEVAFFVKLLHEQWAIQSFPCEKKWHLYHKQWYWLKKKGKAVCCSSLTAF